MGRKAMTKEERIMMLEQQIAQIQNEPDLDVFHVRLKEFLKGKGISETQLASSVGCTPQNINLYTSGKRIPGLDMAVRIARALRVDLGYLAGLRDTP